MTTRPRPRLLVLAAFILVSGCASVPPGSDGLRQQARSFTPPPGKANVYAIRGWSLFEAGIVWPVTLDFTGFGNVGLRSYLYGAISPGDHVLGANLPGPVPSRVTFTAEAGRNYFFEISSSPGWLVGTIRIEPLDEEKGRELVQDYNLSADNRFEFAE